MIEIRVSTGGQEITAQGHSGYEVEGKDIVCASVSSAFVTASAVLKEMNIKHDFGMDPKVPFIGIKVQKKGIPVIKALVATMQILQADYSEFVKVSKVKLDR